MGFPGSPILAAVLLVVVGCSGVDPIKEEMIAELQYQNERQRDLLAKNLKEIRDLEDRLAATFEEKNSLMGRIEVLETNLAFAREASDQAARERDQSGQRVQELERTVEQVQQNLEKVRSVASASAGELAELRLKRQEYEDQIAELSKREARLRDEKITLERQLEEVKEELVRNLAVVRSLRGEGTAVPEGLRAALADLERVRQENEALKTRLSELEKSQASVARAAPSAQTSPAAPAPQAEPSRAERFGVAINDLAALVKERVVKASRGEFTGDPLDFTILGCVAVAFLLTLWVLIRWRRMARLSRQLRLLSSRMLELEQIQAEGPPVYAAAAVESARRPSEIGTRPRPTPVRRRSGFSAVISSKAAAPPADPESVADEEPAQAAPRAEKEKVSPKAQAARDPASEKAAAPAQPVVPPAPKAQRKVIGARVWEEAGSGTQTAPRRVSEEGDVEELANTQLIPVLNVEAAPGGPPEVAAKEETRPRSDAGRSTKPQPKASGEDDDLLEQLRAVVNQKFEELTKKK